jgi:zinc D-Ala-D-Ala dipeptidase
MLNTIAFEAIASNKDFRRLDTISGLKIDLRYASEQNFLARNLYAPMDCAWLHQQAAQGVEKAIDWLNQNTEGFQLIVLDALRPQRIQEQLWASLAGTNLQMYLADPARKSIHSFGMAVDVTLLDSNANALDMGSDFDEMVDRSHPEHEAKMLQNGLLTAHQISNRKILRAAMTAGGFIGISTEWWHFDHGDRAQVRAQFSLVL